MTGAVLAVDCGGTEVKAGIVLTSGAVCSEVRVPSREADGVNAWSAAAMTAARRALAAWHGPDIPSRLGLSVPGAVDPSTATLVDLVARLPADPLPLAGLFEPLGLPVAADNDARAALRAERRWGIARDVCDVVLFTIGTGLGGAAHVGGRPPGGDPVLAGSQLGHLAIDPDGGPCVCGNLGCAERLASGPGLVALARQAGLAAEDAATVFSAARDGSPAARMAIGRFTTALAAAVVNAIHAYQPSLVVLGGGVMRSSDLFLPALRDLVAKHAWTIPRGRVRIEPSTLGDHLGVLGAAAVALANVAG